MPSFHDTTVSTAPPEEVWKLLYDPARFPDWWAGIGSVEVGDGGEYTMYPEGYPDFPMAQVLDTARAEQRVTVSCLVSDLLLQRVPEAAVDRHPGLINWLPRGKHAYRFSLERWVSATVACSRIPVRFRHVEEGKRRDVGT